LIERSVGGYNFVGKRTDPCHGSEKKVMEGKSRLKKKKGRKEDKKREGKFRVVAEPIKKGRGNRKRSSTQDARTLQKITYEKRIGR